MSTDFYGIRVLERSTTSVVLRLNPIYVDIRGLFPDPYNPQPFFEMLAEPFSGGAGADPVLKSQYPDWYDISLDEAARHIRSVQIIDLGRLFKPMEYDFYYEVDGQWPAESELPFVTYRIEVFDPSVIAHLHPGAGWGSVCSPRPYRREQPPPDHLNEIEPWLLGLGVEHAHQRPLPSDYHTISQLRALLHIANTNRSAWFTWSACEILGSLGESARVCIPDLARLLGDQDIDVAYYAAEALGALAQNCPQVARWLAIMCAHRAPPSHSGHTSFLIALSCTGVDDPIVGQFIRDLDHTHPTILQTERVLRDWCLWRSLRDPQALEAALSPLNLPSSIDTEDTPFLLILAARNLTHSDKKYIFDAIKALVAQTNNSEYRTMAQDYLNLVD